MGVLGALRVIAVAVGLSHPAGKTGTDAHQVSEITGEFEIDTSCWARVVNLVVVLVALNDLLDAALDVQLAHTVAGLDTAEAPGYAALLVIAVLVSLSGGVALKLFVQWGAARASAAQGGDEAGVNLLGFAFAEVAMFLVEDGTTMWLFRRVPGAYTGDAFDQANLLTTAISAVAALCTLGYASVRLFWVPTYADGRNVLYTAMFFVVPAALVVFTLWVAAAQVYPGVEEVPLLTDLESPEGRGQTAGYSLGFLWGILVIVFMMGGVVDEWGKIRTGAGKLYRGGAESEPEPEPEPTFGFEPEEDFAEL
jgi:hypothetical protein